MRVRRAAAANAARLSSLATRALGRGGGTALPGLIATALDPRIVAELAAQLPAGSFVVSGTNGKTTTSRMLGAILQAAGFEPIRNASGSNLTRGLASSLIRETGITGDISAHDRTMGLFEVDEAALPEVTRSVVPSTLLLLNLFRDQLDRYGEVATVAGKWKSSVAELPHTTSVVANADDPLIADVTLDRGAPTTYFGVASAERGAVAEHASDVKACPRCGAPVEYTAIHLGHLGHYRCSACDFARPEPTVEASDVRLDGVDGSRFSLTAYGDSVAVSLPLPGMYNVYNALAAAAGAHARGVPLSTSADALARVTPAFGRMERIATDGRSVCIALAKNPAGLNEVLRTIASDGEPLHLLVMLNDNVADGRDVSWIWDADVEALEGKVRHVIFAGTRAEDMALRFKYAGAIPHDPQAWLVEHDTRASFQSALAGTPAGSTLFVVPTYTAMLDVRSTMARLGHVREYWEE